MVHRCGGDVVFDFGFGSRRSGGDASMAGRGEGKGDDVALRGIDRSGGARPDVQCLPRPPVDDFHDVAAADLSGWMSPQGFHNVDDIAAALRPGSGNGLLDLPEVTIFSINGVQVFSQRATAGFESCGTFA